MHIQKAKICANLLPPGTIEQGDWKQTIDHYCIIIYEHTMLVAGVFFIRETQNFAPYVSEQDQNDILHQPEYNFNVIFKNKMLL